MNPDVWKYLEDVLLSINHIESYMTDKPTLKSFKEDLKTTDAVERRLGIIGEALFKAVKLEDGLTISDVKRIIKLRLILVHKYDLIDADRIYVIVNKDLPILKKEIESLLASFNSEA